MTTSPQQQPLPSIREPFLLDAEQLQQLADAQVVKTGLAWFRENRVIDWRVDDTHLWATVEDEHSEEPLSCALHYEDSQLQVECECQQSKADRSICAHAIAALYACADDSESMVLAGAVDAAISTRAKRGRTEVEVESLGDGGLGPWHARSINSENPYSRAYRVNIRTLERRGNFCTCPDFATNQLGTCKHVEAVLHQIRKRPDFANVAKQAEAFSYVYLAWDTLDPPQIMLHRHGGLPDALKMQLDQNFDASGAFKRRLPDDFYRFAEWIRDEPLLDIGEDVLSWVHRLTEKASQQLRANEIHAQISASGGHLPGIRARLYPYQVEGVAFLAASGRALLADDMGLGKTLQAISAASWLMQHDGVARVLVVCPASLKHQWAREIEKFTDFPVQVIQGGPQARGVQYRRGDGFFVVNYELVLRDLSVINEALCPDLMILDEAQRIKNWRTKIAAAVKQIACRYAFVLSGTPMENRLEDLYSLMQVIDASILGPLWRYMVDFHITDERERVLGYRNLSELRQRLAPVMLRRNRQVVSKQLPQRIEQRLDVELTPAQQELHDSALGNAGRLANIAKTRPLTPVEQNRLMSFLQQARMACNAAGLVDKESEGAPKLDELADLIDELCVQSGRKAVVFSQWEQMTRMVEQRLKLMQVSSVRLHGGVPTAKRGELMARFNEDDAIQVFISTDAGGVGLNLQSASVLINLDIPWNPAVLDQRIARVHRLGQRRTVQTVILVSADSYEEHVMQLVKGKRHLFDNVVDPEAKEDVVGVSKKLLETLADDLADDLATLKTSEDDQQPANLPPEDRAADGEAAKKEQVVEPDTRLEQGLARCVERLQAAFGVRLERILGAGGGLLVVLDHVDNRDDREAQELSVVLAREYGHDITIALIDRRTLGSLQRLGAASPVQSAELLYEADSAEQPQTPALIQVTQEKLDAAEVLMQSDQHKVAAELIIAALLNTAAVKSGLDSPPATQDTAVWLYAEALPNGWLDDAQANLILRALALTQAPELPPVLVEELAADVRAFVIEVTTARQS